MPDQAESGLSGLGNHPVVKGVITSLEWRAQTSDLKVLKSFANALPHLKATLIGRSSLQPKATSLGLQRKVAIKQRQTLMEEAIATADTHGLKNEKKELKSVLRRFNNSVHVTYRRVP